MMRARGDLLVIPRPRRVLRRKLGAEDQRKIDTTFRESPQLSFNSWGRKRTTRKNWGLVVPELSRGIAGTAASGGDIIISYPSHHGGPTLSTGQIMTLPSREGKHTQLARPRELPGHPVDARSSQTEESFFRLYIWSSMNGFT
jgi:hypothetical protein